MKRGRDGERTHEKEREGEKMQSFTLVTWSATSPVYASIFPGRLPLSFSLSLAFKSLISELSMMGVVVTRKALVVF